MELHIHTIQKLLGFGLPDTSRASVHFTRLIAESIFTGTPIGLFVVQYWPHKSPEIVDGRLRHNALRSLSTGFVFEVDAIGLSSRFLSDERTFYMEAGRFAERGGDPKKLERMRDQWRSFTVPVATLGEYADGMAARSRIEAGRTAR